MDLQGGKVCGVGDTNEEQRKRGIYLHAPLHRPELQYHVENN
jgi:hypothetical protein